MESLENRIMLVATTIDVFVAGSTGEEVLTLQIAGQNVQSWTGINGDYVAGIYEQYSYVAPDTVTADQVRLVFTNDGVNSSGVDRNLRIDGISIDGQFYESESPGVASFGSWDSVDGCEFGFKQSEYLHCEDGYLQYELGWSSGLFIVDTAADENNGDYSRGDRSLREALSLATGSGSHRIEFDASLAGAAIPLNSELHPTGNVEIVGLGSELLTIDAQGTAATTKRAMLIDSGITVTISGVTLEGGYTDRGGAIRVEQGNLNLQQVVLRDNLATTEGGAIYYRGDSLQISRSTIQHNTAQLGGAIYAELNDGATLSIDESSLQYNTAEHASLDSAGGALYAVGQSTNGASNSGTVDIINSTVAYNSSRPVAGSPATNHHSGGVYLNQIAQGKIAQSTFSNNLATNTSGGIQLADSGSIEMINSTIAFNQVENTAGSGLVITGNTAANVANTIVAENRSSGVAADVAGAFLSSSTRNLIGSGTNPGGSNNTILTANEQVGLALLADNGGPTQTHALLPDSPAVDGGSDSRTYDPGNIASLDQRGYKRYVNYVPGVTAGIVDIGAYELQPQIVSESDFDGDGRQDQAFFDPISGNLDVLTDRGDRTESSSWGQLSHPLGNTNWNQFQIGDFNGDGRDDLAAYHVGSAEWTLAISDGNRFSVNHLQLQTGNDNWQTVSVGDFDGDGSDELIGRTQLSANWQVLQFDEATGVNLEDWGHAFGGFTDWTLFVGDVDQDGRDDLVGRRPFVPGNWYAVISEDSEVASGHFSSGIGLGKSLDPYFHNGNFTTAEFDQQFHRRFAEDPASVDTQGPFNQVLEQFTPIYNEYELQFYPGLMKGPQATRETQAGNPWDLAALLVEDLIAAGHQAEIVTGKITVPVSELMDWTGTLTEDAAISLVAWSLAPDLTTLYVGNELSAKFRHAWVRVQLPTATGIGWIDLDPAWKFKNRQPGIQVVLPGPRGSFDEFGYLADPSDQSPLEYYEGQVANYLSNNGINASLAEVPYDGPIRQKHFTSIPIDDRLSDANNVISEGTFSQIVTNDANAHTHRVRLNIAGWNRDIIVPDSSLSTFTIQRDLSSFTFWVNGIAETTVNVPTSSELRVTHATPGESFASSPWEYTIPLESGTTGKYYTLTFDAKQQSQLSLNRHREALNSAAADGVTNSDIPTVLEYVGAKYWHDMHNQSKAASEILHGIEYYNVIRSGITKADNDLILGDFSHLQTPIIPQNLSIDLPIAAVEIIDSRLDFSLPNASDYHEEASQLADYAGSALEHSIIEEVSNNRSVSTVRGFKDAYQGDPFLSGLPSNSLFFIESVLEGGIRKVYIRGEIGLRANENGYLPYDATRTDTEIVSAQLLRDWFIEHKYNPAGANDAANNPQITFLWDYLTTDVMGSATAIVPWSLSHVGNSQSNWSGSVYFLSKQTLNGVLRSRYAIAQVNSPAPLNGGHGSGEILPANPLVQAGANFFRNFAGDPVDVLNGNMFRDELDVAMPNAGVPLDFSRHYNSQLTYNLGLGIGWTHSFSDRLLQKNGVADELIWLTPKGVRHNFKKIAGIWKSPPALFGTLEEVSGGYRYLENDGLEHHFKNVTSESASSSENYLARLAQIVDRNGHGIEVTYPNSNHGFVPNAVRDIHSSARRLDLTLAGGNRITTIKKYSAGLLQGTWQFDYDASGPLLTQATNPLQQSVVYEYYNTGSSANLISRIQEPDNSYHAYEYYPNRRTFRVREGVFDGTNYIEQSAHSFSYDIGRNRTEFTDENGYTETYVHQENGRLIRHIHADRSRMESTWGIEDGAGGIVTDTELLMRSQTNETGGVRSFEYYLNESGTNTFKNRRLYRSTAPQLPGESSLVTEYNYEQAGAGFQHIVNLSSVTVAPGNSDARTTAFQYDSKGRLSQVTNPLNQIRSFDYYADNHATTSLRGMLMTETRPDSANPGSTVDTIYSYNSAGQVTSASTDGLPASTTSYHHTGLPELITDATGVALHNSYDDMGRRSSSTRLGDLATTADDQESQFSFDTRGRLIESTDALGRSTTWSYDRRGNVTQETDSTGAVVRHFYDSRGNRIATTDAKGQKTKFLYDNRNRLIQTIHPDGASEAIRYDGTGRVVAALDALGRETHTTYSTLGHPLTITSAVGSPEQATTNNRYNLFGELIETIDPMGNIEQSVRDTLGRVTKTQVLNSLDGANPTAPMHLPVEVTTTDYDAHGNVIRTVDYNVATLNAHVATLLSDDPRSLSTSNPQHVQVTQHFYDSLNRQTKTTFADNSFIRTDYDDAGRIRFQYNELNRVTEYQYDNFGRLSTTIASDPDGTAGSLVSPITRFEYDDAGNRTTVIDPRGQRTHQTFDALNRIVATTDADGGRQRSVYDLTGQLTTTIDALGRASYTQLDPRDRTLQQRTADPDGDGPLSASTTHYQYDAVGNHLQQIDPGGVLTTYQYDAQNRLIQAAEPSYVELSQLIDDGDSGFRVVTDSFPVTTQSVGYNDSSLFVTVPTAQDKATARWKFEDIKPGTYRVLATWEGRNDASDNVTATLSDAIPNLLISGFDQTKSTDELLRTENGATRGWVVLATNIEITVASSQNLKVLLSSAKGDNLIADAVRLERIPMKQSRYDLNGNLIAEIDSLGRQTDYTYDELNRRKTTTLPDPDGDANPLPRPLTTFEYDGYSNLIRTIEHRGGQNRELVSTYDQRNRVVSETRDANAGSAEEVTTLSSYDSAGNLVQRIDAYGTAEQKVTQYRYDRLNRLISEWYHSDETVLSEWQQAVISSYDASDNLISQIDRVRHDDGSQVLYRDSVTDFSYDRLNRQVTTTVDTQGSLAATSRTRYDTVGNRLQTTDPLGRVERNEFDRLDRTVRTHAPDPDGSLTSLSGSTTTFTYDSRDNLLTETNGAGETKRYRYDSRSRRVSSFDPLNAETRSVYDSEDNMLSLIDPLGNQTTYTYDALNRRTAETITLNSAEVSRQLAYDAQGNLAETIDRNGLRRTYQYDRLDRRRFERWFDAISTEINTLEWQYDARGRVVLQQDDNKIDTFDYDILSRVTAARNYDPSATTTARPRVELRWQHDALDPSDNNDFVRTIASQHQIDQSTLLGQTTQWTDRRGRTVRTVDTAGSVADKQIDFTFDLADQLIAVTRTGDSGNFRFDTQMAYNLAGYVRSIEHLRDGASNPFVSYNYEYDLANRINSQTTNVDQSIAALSQLPSTNIENFSFDLAGQLTADDDQSYGYDTNGNRTDSGLTVVAHNRLSEDADYSYTYDNEGNRIRRDSKADSSYTLYTWDHRNRLTQVAHFDTNGQPDGVVHYGYNADNVLVEKTTNGNTEHYIVSDNHRVLELADNGTLRRRLLWSNAVDQLLLDESYNTSGQHQQTLWAATDQTGSVRQLLNTNEQIVEHRDYDSFGSLDQAFSETGAAIGASQLLSTVGFTGKHFDTDAQLQYSTARWYDPTVGRFLSEDPIGFAAGAGRYQYGEKN